MKEFDHTSGEYLETDGAKIYFEQTGKPGGPVLLLLHGGFGSMNDFDVILEELSETYKIIGVDSRGQGKSTMGKVAISYEQIQKDVLKILGHLNINKLSVIGFSDGGIVAYRLAALGDLHIEKLVTISSRWNIKDALLTKDMFLAITPENYREEFPKAYETYQKLNPAADFDNLTGRLVKMWLDPGPGGYLNEGLKSIRCPLLIVRGDDDVILTRNSVVEIANLIEGSSLLNIPFATHPAFKQQKELFMISLLQFLKS